MTPSTDLMAVLREALAGLVAEYRKLRPTVVFDRDAITKAESALAAGVK